MKIIFDSFEQKEEFLRSVGSCPSDSGYVDRKNCIFDPISNWCVECWDHSGVEIEIKTEEAPSSKPIDIFYLCDGDACSWECFHTDDIVHACNAEELNGRLFRYEDRGDRIGFFEVGDGDE